VKIVAHMPVRNEVDVIVETVGEAFRWVDTLIALDGASTDGTYERLLHLQEMYGRMGKTLQVVSEPDPGDEFHDYTLRGRLLELTAPYEPDWVLSIDADEIYDSYYDPNGIEVDPITAICAAEEAGANVVRNWVPQFWLTFQDLREDALNEDETISVQQRRRWYSWGWMGTFIWKWNDAHYYPVDVAKRTPEMPGQDWRQWQRAGPLMPICKHYCFRSLAQGLDRAGTRRERGGRYYFGKYFGRWVVDEQLAGLHYLADDNQWRTENNHARVHQYVSGDLNLLRETAP